MRCFCIHVMNDFGLLLCLCRACKSASRVTLGGPYALSLLFHLKSWFAQKLNYATAFARVYKQYLPRNVNITF